MATYAIGDLQGCYSGFIALLEKISFNPAHDNLVLLGDIINRGPDSLRTLKLVYELRNSVSVILGNHDLNTMAVLAGHREIKPKDTIETLIKSTTGIELLHWLRSQPLLHVNEEYVFCHAGIYPYWSLSDAQERAKEVEVVLQGPNYKKLLKRMYGPKPNKWSDDLEGWKRLRFILNTFTRMRYITRKGKLDHEHSGKPGSQTKNLIPWFELPERVKYSKTTIIGHWSTLGLYNNDNVICLDTGCVWGGRLTAIELNTKPYNFHSVQC